LQAEGAIRFGREKAQVGRTSLNLRAGDQQSPQYLKLYPNAVVPTLVNDGTVIIESSVISEYLDDAYPEPPLRPKRRCRPRPYAPVDQTA
jgi:glutathione S-transferase